MRRPLTLAAGAARADDPQSTIAALDASLAKIGGTDEAGDKTVPALFSAPAKSTTLISDSLQRVEQGGVNADQPVRAVAVFRPA